MSVPEYYEIYLPLLETLNTKPAFLPNDVYGPLATRINEVSGEEKVILKNGGYEFVNRVNWAIIHLKEAGLLKEDDNHYVSVTDEGKRVLSSLPHRIDNDFLMQYQSFRIYDEESRQKNVKEDIDDTDPDNEPRIKTVKEWIGILQNEIEEETSVVSILKCYITRPNFEGDQNSIKTACGFKDLTFKIVRFGERIIKQTGIPRIYRDRGNSNIEQHYYNIPFKGRYFGKKFLWRLRPELVDALLILDADVEQSLDKTELIKIDTNVDLELVEWDYLERHVSNKRNSGTLRKQDYDLLSKTRRNIGDAGEELVLRYEKTKLKKCGRDDLSEKVRWDSKEKGDGLGYDIYSFDTDGNEMLIEVKTTSRKENQLQFYISDNEVKKYFDNENVFIYFVFDIHNKPKLHIVKREQFVKKFLTPCQYYVNIDVVKNNSAK